MKPISDHRTADEWRALALLAETLGVHARVAASMAESGAPLARYHSEVGLFKDYLDAVNKGGRWMVSESLP